jgi:hypothetical protein
MTVTAKTQAPLDVLFGQGTAAAFAERVNLAALFAKTVTTITEQAMENGGVYVTVTWATSKGVAIGRYELEYFTGLVHCPNLAVEPAYRNKGVLLKLMKGLAVWWPTLGLKAHTLAWIPGSPGEATLRLCGFAEYANGAFGGPLPATKCAEYLAWVANGSVPAEEPAWRAVLPKPSQEAF